MGLKFQACIGLILMGMFSEMEEQTIPVVEFMF